MRRRKRVDLSEAQFGGSAVDDPKDLAKAAAEEASWRRVAEANAAIHKALREGASPIGPDLQAAKARDAMQALRALEAKQDAARASAERLMWHARNHMPLEGYDNG